MYTNTNTSAFNSKAFSDLSESVDPESIGSIIGAGSQTIVIDPYNEWIPSGLNLKDAVIVFSKEKEKYKFLKSYFKKNVQRLIKDNIWDELRDFVCYLESEGWHIFYMEKMEPVFISDETLIARAMSEFNAEHWHLTANSGSVTYYLSDLDINIENLCNYTGLKLSSFDKAINKAIKSSLRALKNSKIDSSFKFDLHENQFVKFEDKIYCVDPVLFNYNNY